MSYRQARAWDAWFRWELNRPGRIEHYLMSIAAEIRRVLSTKPRAILNNHFQLAFKFVRGVIKRAMTREQAQEIAAAKLGALFGIDIAKADREARERKAAEYGDGRW